MEAWLNIRTPSQEVFAGLRPACYDIEMAGQKGLCEADGSIGRRYIWLQAAYRAALGYYLAEEVGLKRYDNAIKESRQGFAGAAKEEQSLSQLYDGMGLDFIYMRNICHIERIPQECLDALKTALTVEPLAYGAVADIIRKTYREALPLKPNINHESDRTNVIYDWTVTGDCVVPNDALVFKINATPDYRTFQGAEGMKKAGKSLGYLKNLMEEELPPVLSMPVAVIIE